MSLNDFAVLAKIGEGAYSTVLKVKRISDGKIYALKQVKINSLKEKEKQNALNEVRLLASISSDHIIKYKESFFDQRSSTLCIVMEFAQNGDLEKLIARRKAHLQFMPEKEVWKLARHIVSALSVLHHQKIIHRDLKCANIFICKGEYKIADLNVSKLLKQSLAYTQTGTPYYASPQVWQDKPYSLKSDIWSLGCILYEVCALKPPFTANSMDGLYKKVIKGVYPRLPATYSEKLQKFIGKCIQLIPAKRPDCQQLFDLLPEQSQGAVSIGGKTENPEINLLSTIKVPKNLTSWKTDLPRSNYNGQAFDTLSMIDTEKPNSVDHRPFGQISQERLREIVRNKQIERESLIKKNSLKRVSPAEGIENRLSNRGKVYTQLQDSRERNLLPRLKINSQASDMQSQEGKRIQEILARVKQNKRKQYDYERPTWWG